MARPIKTGLDYFPKDTGSFSDRKMRRLLAEFGAKGYLIFDYLLCEIYRDKGYFVQYDDDFAFDVADNLSGVSEDLVKEVINGCVRVGLFDKDLFDSVHILTSSGIQKRYLLAKRNGVIDENIRIIAAKTHVNNAKTHENNAESTQSKVKKSKVKKTPPLPPLPESSFSNQLQEFERVCMTDEIWHEQVAISLRIRTIQEVMEWVKKYFMEMKGRDEFKVNLRETRSHCYNWIKQELRHMEKSGGKTAAPVVSGASDRIKQKYFQHK